MNKVDDRKRHLILAIKELPRPKGTGAFCYRYSDRTDSGVLAYLELYNTDKEVLRPLLRKGLAVLLQREQAVRNDKATWLSGYVTENMQLWVCGVLDEVVGELFVGGTEEGH